MRGKKNGGSFCLMRRLIAAVVACSMTLYGNVGFATPVASTAHLIQDKPISLLDLSIPKEIGEIKETFKGQDEKVVFVIQDAHEIPDAQRNIQKLIDFLQKEHRIRLVALEGAATDLDPQIFQSFPDQELLKKVFERYFDQGELAGGTAAAIFNESPAVYHGVEDWSLYEEGLKHFLDAMEMEESVTERLERLFGDLRQEKEKHYSKELLKIDLALQAFRKNVTDLISLLEKLAAVRPPEKETELALLLEEVGRSRANDSSIDAEVRDIADQIRTFLRKDYSEGAKQDLIGLNQKFQESQTSRITPEAFALFLKGLAIKYRIKVKVSKRLNYLVGNQKRMKDIQGTKLFDDLEKYAQSVKETLFQSEEERKLNTRSHQLELMERLARLELSREDWNEVKEIFNEIQYWNISGNGSTGRGDIAGLLQEMRPQISFYHNAGKRDHAFIQQVNSLLQEHNAKSAAFIAGGFHAEGVTYALKSKGISYVLVMPKINRVPDETAYRDHMKGKVSWGDYFEVQDGKVNLYNAFVRGTRDLILKLSKEERGRVLKGWRDQIIRDLAEKGKIIRASQYTRFIDEVSDQNKRDDHLAKWETNINRFIAGLRDLRTEGRITEENIAKLLPSAAIPALVTSPGGMLGRAEVRADLVLPAETRSEVRSTEADSLGDEFGQDVEAWLQSVRGFENLEEATRHTRIKTALERYLKEKMPLLMVNSLDPDHGNAVRNFIEAFGSLSLDVLQRKLIRLFQIYHKYSHLLSELNQRIGQSEHASTLIQGKLTHLLFTTDGKNASPMRYVVSPYNPERNVIALNVDALLVTENDVYAIEDVAHEAGHGWANRFLDRKNLQKHLEEDEESLPLS